uniref:Unkown protein n=1 Tax=Riptortus pedestris TaxID=329032 RepID=R4WKL8_RIPPE|nr:unkown protein [Riptortus pedestris]
MFDDRRSERRPMPVIEESHELMDFLVFATIVLLWTSGLIMIIFGVYVLISEYGLSVLMTLNLYPYTMILQCLAAFTILLGASVTTSLLTLDHGVPKRAIISNTERHRRWNCLRQSC